MASAFQPHLTTTGIGSLPLTEGERASSFVLEAGLGIPFWPQLPKRHFLEQMIPQYSEAMPCVHTDAEGARITFDPAEKYKHLEPFYEAFLSGDLDGFGLSEPFAAGFHAFERAAAGRTWPIVKGQVTGPISFCMGIKDADGNPLYNDPELRDAAVKLLTRKAEWQIERLKAFASERVLVFVDEPVLAAYGSSAYVGISEEDVRALEGEVLEAITAAGAIAGMHVCGNSDWGVALRTGVQVLNFDAYQYGTTIALYPDEVRNLFDRGGCIAWGIVPTSDAIAAETVDSLAQRLHECMDALAAKGFADDLLCERSLLTPSCGAGSMSVENARRVFDLLEQLRQKVAA
jgi:hypothetical protein